MHPPLLHATQNPRNRRLARIIPPIYDIYSPKGVDVVDSDRLPPVKVLEDAEVGDVEGGEHRILLELLKITLA